MTTKFSTLNLRIKELKYIRPMIGKENLTCQLDVNVQQTLEKIAERRFVRVNMLIDTIVQRFQPTYEDVSFFMRGDYEPSFKDRFIKFFSPTPEKVFTTFQVDKKTYQRIHNLKSNYNLSKSIILKYIVIKFIKENHYAS